MTFYCLGGNKQIQSGLSLPLSKKRKLYQVPTARGKFAFRIKVGVSRPLGPCGSKSEIRVNKGTSYTLISHTNQSSALSFGFANLCFIGSVNISSVRM